MIRVIVCAANPIIRTGLESIVHTQSAFEFSGSAVDLATLLLLIEERQPDVVLLQDQGTATETLLAPLLPQTEVNLPIVILLIDVEDSKDLLDLLSLGVQAVLPSAATAEEIVAALKATAAGLVVLNSDATELLSKFKSGLLPLTVNPVEALSAREIEVLEMLALGIGNRAIAIRLGISEHTVKFHVSSIFSKLNVTSRTEAVTVGLRQGLIMI